MVIFSVMEHLYSLGTSAARSMALRHPNVVRQRARPMAAVTLLHLPHDNLMRDRAPSRKIFETLADILKKSPRLGCGPEKAKLRPQRLEGGLGIGQLLIDPGDVAGDGGVFLSHCGTLARPLPRCHVWADSVRA